MIHKRTKHTNTEIIKTFLRMEQVRDSLFALFY